MADDPKTLQEAILYFSNPVNCREYLIARRWPDGVVCPKCGSKDVLFLERYNRWHCRAKHDAPQFTLKTGTIMEDSPISLDKWMTAMWQIVNCKNGISSYEVKKAMARSFRISESRNSWTRSWFAPPVDSLSSRNRSPRGVGTSNSPAQDRGTVLGAYGRSDRDVSTAEHYGFFGE